MGICCLPDFGAADLVLSKVCKLSRDWYTFYKSGYQTFGLVTLISNAKLCTLIYFPKISFDVGVSTIVNKASYCIHVTFISCPVEGSLLIELRK